MDKGAGLHRGQDEATLKDMLDSCVNFEERRKIRNALREVQGLNSLVNGGIKPLSFRPRKVKSEPTPQNNSSATKKSDKVVHLSLGKDVEKAVELEHIAWRSSLCDDLSGSEFKSPDLEKSHEIRPKLVEHKEKEVPIKSFRLSSNLDDVNSVFSSISTPKINTEFDTFCYSDNRTASSREEKYDNEVFDLNGISGGEKTFQFPSIEVSSESSVKVETLKNRQNKTCRFFSRGRITSEEPKHAINSDKKCANNTDSMEGQTKSYRSQLIIGSIGNPKAAKLSDQSNVFTNNNNEKPLESQDTNSANRSIKQYNSLKVLKNNDLKTDNNHHDGGTVITEELRRKSLDLSSLTNSISLLNNQDGGSVITKEKRRSLDPCLLDLQDKYNNNKNECVTNYSAGSKHLLHDESLSKPKRENESGTVITEEIRRRSLDHGSLKINLKENREKDVDNSEITRPKRENESGTNITEEIRRRSLDHGSLKINLKENREKDVDNSEISRPKRENESGTDITEEIRRRSFDFGSLKNNLKENREKDVDNSEISKPKRENESGTDITEEIRRRSFDHGSLKNDLKANKEVDAENSELSFQSQVSESQNKEVEMKMGLDIFVETSSDIDKGEDKPPDVVKENDTVTNDKMMENGCSDCQQKQESSGDSQSYTEEELILQLQALQTRLKECSDFSQRRKIRGRIRKLREQIEAFDLRRKPSLHQLVDNCTRINDVAREVTQNNPENSPFKDYSQVDSKDELRKSLSQTNDYEEKKQIRLALRQLRQRDRERESGDSRSGPTACLTRSQSVKDFNRSDRQATTHPHILRCTSEIHSPEKINGELETCIEHKQSPLENGYANEANNVCLNRDLRQSGSSDSNGRLTPENQADKDSDENSLPSPLRRSFSLNSLRKKRLEKDQLVTSSNSSNHKSVHSNSPESCSSSSEFSEHSKENLEHSKVVSKHSKNGNSQHSLQHSKGTSIVHSIVSNEKHSKDLDKSRRSSVPASVKPFRDSEEHRSGSESDSSSCRDWLENKRRNSVTVIDTKKLNSTMDIEAAFSEILNAVDTEDENNNEDDSPELEIMEVDGQENISIKTPRIVSDKSISSLDINCNSSQVETVTGDVNCNKVQTEDVMSERQVTPVKQKPVFTLSPITPQNNSMSVIEDDDGSITVQSVSYKDQGDHTVTEKTTLRRSHSRSEEEERDTVIESKLTSPGGSDHFEKDVIKTKRKLTSRGSDYFSRSQFKSKWLRNKEGETIEEHDVMVESDNFSVSKGQSWGDRSEATVQLNKQTNQIPNVVPEIQASHDSGDRLQVHGPNRMDVSKASSGYGSVSGSDEEEKEEVVATTQQVEPSSSPEIKVPLKDLITLEGSNAVLECIVTCSPSPDITWYKGDKSLMNNRHYEHKFDINSGRAILTVLNGSKDDSGPYRCLFKNPLGEAETKAALTVRSRAKKKPSFTKNLKNMSAVEGQSVCLECALNDATHVAWYKDGIIQRNTSDFKQTFDGLNAKLEIDEIFVDDHGEYACVAKNDFGENKTTCRINVKETANETDVVPMFLTKPESKIHECNDTITLQCDVIGSPQPTIEWCRNQESIGNSKRHKQTFDGRTALLLITKATIEDSGKYECIAVNTSGKVSVDALIVVKAKQMCPEILSQLTDQTAVCGKSLTLKCDVNGNPSPMIVWKKDNRIIGNTKDFRQTYQDVTAKLQINDIHKEDKGCYECMARNVHGAVSTKCSISVEGTNSGSSGAEEKSKKQFDWLVGRDQNTPIPGDNKPKEILVKRSESMKISSNHSLRDKYRKAPQTDSSIQEVAAEPKQKVAATKETSDGTKDSDVKVDINMNRTKFEDPLKQKAAVARSKGPEDPPWKNVTLRRTESARAPVGRRESPFLQKRKAELSEKLDSGSPKTSEDPSTLVTQPPGWRPSIGGKKDQDVKKESEILSTLRQVNLRRSDSARCLRDEVKQTGSDFSANLERDSGTRTDNYRANKTREEDTPKVGQTSSTRLLFERKVESENSPKDTPLTNFLNRPGSGLRRTSSLKITQAERDSGTKPLIHSRMNGGLDLQGTKAGDRKFVNKEGDQKPTGTMPTYDNIDDEEELHKILSKTDDFEERKKIRNRMRELREIKSKGLEVKRLQREKETEEIFKKRFQDKEDEQKRQIKAFEKAAQDTKQERERILTIKDDILKDSVKAKDDSKKRQLEAFDKIAQKGGEGVVKQQSGFGGASYTKTPEQAAKFLSDKLINAGSPVIGGKITVRTEAWNSQDGVTNKSEKTETWGAQPSGAQGAMNKFKSMEPAGGAKPNGLIAVSLAKRAAKTMQRNAVAIKQEILHFVKSNTQGYENVEVTNFSSSWNNGMAFCALIHHFYPDSFDFGRLDPKKRRANFTLAFDIAEKHADIAPLLDVDDMVKMQKPDWKCVFTYVQSFYRKLNDHPRNSARPSAEQ